MFAIEQIAVRTPDLDKAVIEMESQGHTNWVRDEVAAVHLYAHPAFKLGENFAVRLAFNYEIIPGQEFELIQLTDGATAQLRHQVSGDTAISHFGYHIADVGSLEGELRRLQRAGMQVVQVSQTTHHANTKRRYRYAFALWPTLGAPLKVIQRIPSSLTVAEGREEFKWLAE